MNFSISSLVVSTIVYFVAAHFIKRWLDDNGIPKGMTRGALVFSVALAASYGASVLVDRIVG